MKVYLVESYYNNGEPYEDKEEYYETEAVCLTKEKAQEVIDNMPLPENWTDAPTKGRRYMYFKYKIDGFKKEFTASMTYIITEMEVTE